jgi:CheY-like chemotaxis protein
MVMSDDLHLLVVDEDPDVRDLTVTFVERAGDGIVAESAPSGATALEKLQAAEFDAVVADYRMPGMNGIELAEAVEEQDLDVVFVLFSAADDPETAAAVAESPVDEFVLKGSGTAHYDDIIAAIHESR